MIIVNRFCRSNSNRCLINYISTTVTTRCDKPKDDMNKTGKEDDKTNEMGKGKQKAASEKLFHLFENDVTEEKRSKAVQKLKTLKMSDAPVTKRVKVTQKVMKQLETRPVDEAAKKAKSPLEHNLVQSAKKVADEFGGNVNKTDTELLGGLSMILDNFATEPKSHKKNFFEEDVEVDRKQKDTKRLKGILGEINKVQLKKDERMKEFSKPIMLSDLLKKSASLDIFHPDLERNKGAQLKIWDELQRDELKYLITSAPRNYYQELIKWTEDGKLWHFPINNEQGMDEEASVDFTEHVFLEEHLEPWCPKSGPLRHFMELVCVGLSKNPYLTVQDKQEHIHWFRDYFEEKKRILQELGAVAGRKEIKQKESEAKQKTD